MDAVRRRGMRAPPIVDARPQPTVCFQPVLALAAANRAAPPRGDVRSHRIAPQTVALPDSYRWYRACPRLAT